MKYKTLITDLSPNKLALLISLIITILEDIIFATLSHLIYNRIDWRILIIISIIFFIISFFLFQFALNKFIYSKIKLIYKKIHNEETNEIHLKNPRNILKNVNEEVTIWATEKREEIDQLKKLEEYRKEFIGNIYHELKTPVFNIQGYVLTLLDGGLEDNNINKKYLKKTENNINRMISIVEDLETISQLEYGELKIDYKNFNIYALTKDIFEILELKANQKSIKLNIISTLEKEIIVHADKEHIRKALSNLILNAINYGIENGKVDVIFYDMDETILIEVQDNGIGIKKENLTRIFERFYRVDKSRSTEHGGTGLGLSIVKHIIEAHNQKINVRSTLGVGTTFYFTLEKSKSNN